ncbi:MAG: hypothetical protein ACI9Y7_000732 [Dokdonia sp.]|jgi:hypothetical protein
MSALTPQKKNIKIAIIAIFVLTGIIGIVLGSFFDIDTHYSTQNRVEIKDMIQVPAIICIVIYAILATILFYIQPPKKMKPLRFFIYVAVYVVSVYSLFKSLSANIYSYANMQSKDNYIIVSALDVSASGIEDELGDIRYYIVGARVEHGYYSELNFEVPQQRYFKIKSKEETIRLKLYEGYFGYYHSPEIRID